MRRPKKPESLDDSFGAGATETLKQVASNLPEMEHHARDAEAFRALARFFTFCANEAEDRVTRAAQGVPVTEPDLCPRARPGRRRCPKCRPLNEPPRCTQRNIGMKSNRCALPKNHGGACRAPRTGDRIKWQKLGIYEKEWPK